MHVTRHLIEAAALNRARAPLYARLSDGRSLSVSRRLILSERLLQPVSLVFDLWNRRWERRGLKILELAVIEMSEAPDFAERFPDHIDHRRPREPVEIADPVDRMLRALKIRDVAAVAEMSHGIVEALDRQPHLYRMTHHVLESVRRAAGMVPERRARAEALGLPPPDRMLRAFIAGQLRLLGQAMVLDIDAADVQIAGVPILLNDLPRVPPYPAGGGGDTAIDRRASPPRLAPR